MAPNVSRLDFIIGQLEKLYADSQDIFDRHVDVIMLDHPRRTSFGQIKAREITTPAGSALNYIAALKLVREKIIGP